MVIGKIVVQGKARLVKNAIDAFSASFPSVKGAPIVGILLWLQGNQGVTAEELSRAMWLVGGEGAAKLEFDGFNRTVTISSYSARRKLVLGRLEGDRYEAIADLMQAPSGAEGRAIGAFASYALENWDHRCSESVTLVVAGEEMRDPEGNFLGYSLDEHQGNEAALAVLARYFQVEEK